MTTTSRKREQTVSTTATFENLKVPALESHNAMKSNRNSNVYPLRLPRTISFPYRINNLEGTCFLWFIPSPVKNSVPRRIANMSYKSMMDLTRRLPNLPNMSCQNT